MSLNLSSEVQRNLLVYYENKFGILLFYFLKDFWYILKGTVDVILSDPLFINSDSQWYLKRMVCPDFNFEN